MNFKTGDKAVYPSHGIAEVRGVEARNVGGHQVQCYVMNIMASGATVMVPVSATKRAGIRSLSTPGEIEQIMDVMKKPARIAQRAWNKRFREFNEKVRTGSACEVAEVYRDLKTLEKTKDLSYGEKQILEKSKKLVVSEISAAKNVAASEIEVEISKCFPVG